MRISYLSSDVCSSDLNAQQSYADIGKGGGENRAAAAAENEPERADELGQTLLDIRHDDPPPRRRPLTPPARVSSYQRCEIGQALVRTCGIRRTQPTRQSNSAAGAALARPRADPPTARRAPA